MSLRHRAMSAVARLSTQAPSADPLLRRVDIDEREGLESGQRPAVVRERGQEPAVRLVQLPKVCKTITLAMGPGTPRNFNPRRPFQAAIHTCAPKVIYQTNIFSARNSRNRFEALMLALFFP
jgi:hypothetical protein